MTVTISSRFRKFGTAIFISVPTVAVCAAIIYKERNRPRIPEETYCDLREKTCVISGATSGIGMATAIQLAQRGMGHIIIGSRDAVRGEDAAERIRASSSSGSTVEVLPLDLADSSSVNSFVKKIRKFHGGIDLLISAAAEIHNKPLITSNGMDATFCSNHLGLQQFVVGMEPSLMRANGIQDGRSRVVIIGSRLENKGIIDPFVLQESRGLQLRPGGSSWNDPLQHYADTKLANQLFVTEISRQWRDSVDVVSVSPGMVNTSLWRNFPSWYQMVTYPLRSLGLRDPDDAAKGVVFAAIARGVKSGSLLLDGKPIQPSENGKDPVLAAKLFKVCNQLLSSD